MSGKMGATGGKEMEKASCLLGGNPPVSVGDSGLDSNALQTRDTAYDEEGRLTCSLGASCKNEQKTKYDVLESKDLAGFFIDSGFTDAAGREAESCSTSRDVFDSSRPPTDTRTEVKAENAPDSPTRLEDQDGDMDTSVHSFSGRARGIIGELIGRDRGLFRGLAHAVAHRRSPRVSKADLDCLVKTLFHGKDAGDIRCRLKSGRLGETSAGLGGQLKLASRKFLKRTEETMGPDVYEEFLSAFSALFQDFCDEQVDLDLVTDHVERFLMEYPLLQRDFRRLRTLADAWKCAEDPDQALDERDDTANDQSAEWSQALSRYEIIKKQMHREGLKMHRFSDVVKWLVPHGRGGHTLKFTYIYAAGSMALFAFMAGAYPTYQKVHGNLPMDATLEDTSMPESMTQWLSLSEQKSFSFDFLLAWGGRYAPALQSGDWWRWFTSPFIHQSFQHLLANLLLLVALAGHLEYNYGTWRTVAIFVLSSLGGNLMSACFEDSCVLVVGASGAVFGFIGFFVADAVLNFESITRPVVRIAIILAFAMFFVFTVFSSRDGTYVSHFSHAGGLLCGLFPAFLILPNIKHHRWYVADQLSRRLGLENRQQSSAHESKFTRSRVKSEVWDKSFWARYEVHPCSIVGLLVLFVIFVVCPILLYRDRIPSTNCKKDERQGLASILLGTVDYWL